MDQRKNEIKSAYKSLGKAHSFYDGMMTGSTVLGKLVLKAVWQMDKENSTDNNTLSAPTALVFTLI